ncbi:MAG: cell division protein ZapA [Paracoccaceae bacterium]
MPDVTINVGGRSFTVSCQPGEEHFLRSAAAILDAEAAPILSQMGRLPESRMLLMAGLMLADRAAGQEDELRQLRARVAELEGQSPGKVEVPVVPAIVTESYAELAARVEAMAAAVEERLAALD